jgi:maltooligosyltrehalose trehalohydrolase
VIAEDERNEPRLMTDLGLDGVWADDFHHQVHVALTGEKDGYYAAFDGTAAEIARTIEEGWSYSGEFYAPKGYVRGRSAEALHARALVYCIQNHDQIGNRAVGERLPVIGSAAGLEAFLAASFLLLTLPMTPLLFMGDEWAATAPFLYFTDHEPELGRRVAEGRRAEFARFARFGGEARAATLPDPQALATFTRSRLDWGELERPPHARVLALYRELLRLRRSDVVLRERSRATIRARAVGDLLVVDRGAGLARQGRRIVMNLGDRDVPLAPEVVGAGSVILTSAEAGLPRGVMPRSTAALYSVEGGSS